MRATLKFASEQLLEIAVKQKERQGWKRIGCVEIDRQTGVFSQELELVISEESK
jgi:hypothetical protein